MVDLPVRILITESLEKDFTDRVQKVSPRLEIRVHPAKRAADVPPEELEAAEVLYTMRAVPDPEQAPNLKWVQFHWAGLDRFAGHPLLQSGVQFTSLSGAAASQMAEYAVMMMLALGHRLPDIRRAQAAGEWAGRRWRDFTPRELRGSVVGLVGYGSVGRETARLCRAFGASVLAVKRDVTRPEDDGYAVPGTGDPEGRIPLRLYPPAGMRRMLGECDFVVVCAPLNRETRGLFDAGAFGAMRAGAYLVDLSRGGIVNGDALCDALAGGQLAGAAMDVADPEPLPPDSRLWSAPNLIISPHIAGGSPEYDRRAAELFAENLGRYLDGRPLCNRFDPGKGY
jgi:phosphoglycerate dehydrogenase-like enzyme